ncbi:MAG TPA: hypothetical protein VJ783_12050 [Pirellulales bacterium]|nr:hypothetical protein [Pirellulales bacterium]
MTSVEEHVKQRARPKTVGWWEPRWSFVPRELRHFNKSFSPKASLRIAGVSAVVTLALYLIVELALRPALPALQIDWPTTLAQVIAGFALILAYLFAICLLLPPYISVSSKRVQIQHGEHVQVITHEQIRVVHFVIRRSGRHFIRVETATTSRRIGISPKVSLDALADHVGEKIVVHDRRRDKTC